MIRTDLAPGVTRIRLTSADCEPFSPVSFRDDTGSFLTQTDCVFSPRPVFRLCNENGSGEVKQTANGEVVAFDAGERRLIRESNTAALRFSCLGSQILTGLGAHEDGVFDYARDPNYFTNTT